MITHATYKQPSHSAYRLLLHQFRSSDHEQCLGTLFIFPTEHKSAALSTLELRSPYATYLLANRMRYSRMPRANL